MQNYINYYILSYKIFMNRVGFYGELLLILSLEFIITSREGTKK